MPDAPVRLLIVDDSRIFRHILEDALVEAEGVLVAGSVWSGEKALEWLESERADVITLDIEMPGMGGLETLAAIRQRCRARGERPPEVLVVSAHTHEGADVALQALEEGAYDVLSKPETLEDEAARSGWRAELLAKIHAAGRGRAPTASDSAPAARPSEPPVAPPTPSPPLAAAPPAPSASDATAADTAAEEDAVIVIGVSTGGPRALLEMLPHLTARTDRPILIAQHMPPVFTRSLAESLDRRCRHRVREGRDGAPVEAGTAWIAPGARHMVLRRGPGGARTIGLNEHPPEHGCRPSADVLFRSAASVCGEATLALILTGMGSDGTQGLGAIRRAGGIVLAQDEASSVVWGMPGSAVEAGVVDRVCPLASIPEAVASALARRRTRSSS